MRAILFDLDGVIYQGNRPIEGAAQVIAWARAGGIPHLFLTNTSSRPRSELCRKLAGMDIAIDAEQILSPPVAAARWLRAQSCGPVALFVPPATETEFAGLPLWSGDSGQAVAAVVIGDLAEAWTFARLNQAFQLLMSSPAPRLVALGMTRYWRTSAGLQLDAGPFVSALQYATGIEPVVTGKPAPAFFLSAAETLGMAPDQLLMVGDDIRGDVEGAQRAGLHALLVRTGKFQPQDLESGLRPDAVLDSVAGVPEWWRAQSAG